MEQPYVYQRPDSQLIQIIDRDANIQVRAPLPESIPFLVANETNETFDFLKIRSKLVQVASGGAEINIDRGIAERQFWRGIINQELTYELNFEAYYSGEIDVVIPIKNLLMMSAPVEKSATIVGRYWSAPNNPEIIVGDLYTLNEVLIKNVNVTYGNKIDRAGNPISAVVSITLITRDPMGRNGINANFAKNISST